MFQSNWEPTPKELKLVTGQVHVWKASLRQLESVIRILESSLSTEELNRAQTYHFQRDRSRFIIGRGLLRKILGFCLNIEPSHVPLCYTAKGKPILGDHPHNYYAINFNVSHTDNLVLYAVTLHRDIGVDVEYIRHISELNRLVKQFFSKAEYNAFLSLMTGEEKQQSFFHGWTRKESFVKATGEGINQPLDQFDVTLTPGEPAQLLSIQNNPHKAKQWMLMDLTLGPCYVATLCAQRPIDSVYCWDLII